LWARKTLHVRFRAVWNQRLSTWPEDCSLFTQKGIFALSTEMSYE
jgi:hypothetical protein